MAIETWKMEKELFFVSRRAAALLADGRFRITLEDGEETRSVKSGHPPELSTDQTNHFCVLRVLRRREVPAVVRGFRVQGAARVRCHLLHQLPMTVSFSHPPTPTIPVDRIIQMTADLVGKREERLRRFAEGTSVCGNGSNFGPRNFFRK